MVKMNNKIKIIGYIASFILFGYTIYIFISILTIGGVINSRIDKEKMEKIFIEDYHLLIIIIDYFHESGYTSVHIRPNIDKEVMSIDSGNQ